MATTTYPTTPSTATLANQQLGAILYDYRDTGFAQGTAIVRDTNRIKQTVDIQRVSRILDFSTAKFYSTASAAATFNPSGPDVAQLMLLGAGDYITGGKIVVKRASTITGTAVATLKLGATSISATDVDLKAVTGTVYAIATGTPTAPLASADTVDLIFGTSTAISFDGALEIILYVQSAR